MVKMDEKYTDILIVGGGPAGMSAAIAAYDAGIKNILICERDDALGGILRQCIHSGFGLHRFGEELTGPEYAERYISEVEKRNIPVLLKTTVLDISADKVVTMTNEKDGVFTVRAGAIILSMGCRERPKGALNIAGTRPAGIYTAGTAQRYTNIMGYMPGRNVVILGSGDIGLIMARRMTLEGAKVHAVCELMPYSGGLARNIEQCLNDFGIPLLLSHTVTEIHGKDRITGVTVSEVDENKNPIPGTEIYIPCDTLLLSVGLIPENELTERVGIRIDGKTKGAEVDQNRETNIPGIFSCGNVLHVHDLVDYVSEEAKIAGKSSAALIKGEIKKECSVSVIPDGKIRYTVPQVITEYKDVSLFFRVGDIYRNAAILVKDGERILYKKKKTKVAPGEMESIFLKADVLRGAKTLEVSLEVL